MFENRIKSIQKSLQDQEVESLLITSTYNIAYLTGIFAFSIEEREARILVTHKNIYLFTDARYTEMVKKSAPFITLVELTATNPFSKCLQKKLKLENIKQLGFEEENIIYKEAIDLEGRLDDIEFIPLEDIVENIRAVKDTNESNFIREASRLTDDGFTYIQKQIKPGMTELEVKLNLENYIRSKNGQLSFESIVAFGPNSAIPHHLSGNTLLKKSDVILLDFGAKINGYCSDMTRTLFMGKPTFELEKMYTSTLESQKLAAEYIKSHLKKGFKLKEAQSIANSYLESVGFSNIPHSLGHGVGLQVHELPWVSPYSEGGLTPGMVITIEPGVYVPSMGGIRIEDTVLVTSNGIEILTKSTKELIILNS